MADITTEPVMATYMEKWSKVNVVAHEQERSAREEYSRACIDWQRIEINRMVAEMQRLRDALERIVRWHGEFPATGRAWPDGDPMSYAACFGSNGERDYMRDVARDALTALKETQP